MSSGNRRIDDFGILAEADDNDLVLVSAANQTYTMRVKTLKDSVKKEYGEAVTAAQAAQEAAEEAVEKSTKAIQDSETALQAGLAAQEAAGKAESSALSALNTATEAKQAAQAAQAAADVVLDSVDGLTPRVENLERKINDVGMDPDDLGLEQDADTGFVYPTYRGVRSENGIPLAATGGGGSGSAGLTYTVTLKNALEGRAVTVADGQPAWLKFTYSSVDEEGYGDGAGVGSITVDGIKVMTFNAEQGENSVDVAPYLTPGEHTVKVRVENSESIGKSISYTVNLVSLSMSTTFNSLATYSGAVTFYYTPVGSGEKTIRFLIDGEEIGTEVVAGSGRSRSYVIPAQPHGGHIFEAYAEMTVGTVTVKSNVLTLGMVWVEAGNTASAIVSPFAVKKAKQGEALAIDYLAYDPTSETAAVTLSIIDPEGKVFSSQLLNVDRTPQTWTVSDYPMGEVTFRLSVRNETIDKVVEVEDSGVDINAITDSRVLNFDAAGRSNQEENPESWTDGTTTAEFTNVAFAGADGWLSDADGSAKLRLLPGSSMFLPFNLFATDHRDNGVTVEVEMSTHNVRDYDSVVMSCLSNGRGFKIASQYAQLNSEQSEVSMQFKEDQRVRVSFVVSPKNLKRMIYVFVDGIMCGAIQYPENDDFSQNPAVGLTVGAESSGIDVYRIAFYTKGLTRQEVLTNYISDRATLQDRLNTYARNNVISEVSEEIVIPKLPATLPYMVISCPELPQSKGNKKTCAITYVDPANALKSFTAANVEIDVQGTSSAGYKKKNFLIKLLEGLTLTSDGSKVEAYTLSDQSFPVSTFCLKADVASSDNANNVELVRLYNDTCPYRHPAMVADNRVRYGIEGYPIVVFWQNTVTGETTFWGKYNFNNDKSTPEPFGWGAGYECWEIKNNTSNRVRFKTSDYGDGWQDDFDAVYPKGLTDTTNLKRLTDWIVSTDRDAVATEAEKTVRLNKFRSEFEQYFVKDAMLYYYLFTETFLMVDNRAKNFFPTYDPKIQRWYPFPYDMDTALGINNEGKLVFDYDLEDTDHVGTSEVYNAQDSTLWTNVRDAFATELAAMYVELRNTNNEAGETPFSYESVLKRFTDHQETWPEAVWNEDAYEKYLRPLMDENDASYLTMLQGNKASQRDWWSFNGFRYRDSKYKAGDANTNFITLRCYSLGDITVTPYSHIWPRVKYGSYTVTERGKRNVPTTLVNPNDKLNDTETYIYSADRIADIGDLSPLQVGYADFTPARKLQKLKLGDGSEAYQNTMLTELYVGNNDLLTEVDVQNCVNLTMSVDLSACDGLTTVKAKGCSATGFSLPVGGHIKTLELPATITNFTIQNQKFFESVTFEGYGALATVRVENTPNVPIDTIINSAGQLSRVRLIGMEWEVASEEILAATIEKLKGCRGLDASGGNTEKAVVNGRVYIDTISTELLEEIQNTFPELIVVVAGEAMYLVRYLNYDGTVLHKMVVSEGDTAVDPVTAGLIDAPARPATDGATYVYSGWDALPESIQGNVSIVAQYTVTYAVRFYNEGALVHTQWVQEKANCPDPVSAGYIAAPTKEPTAQYSYVFSGWDKLFSCVTEPMAVNAVFTESVRTYTVYFYNGSTLLQKVENVAYGGNASYTGATPEKGEEDYVFTGWDPEAKNITGDTYCYAQFRYNGLYSVKFVERSMAGAYENDRVKTIGSYAFNPMSNLVSIAFPQAESVGEYGFSYDASLVSANLPSVTTIDGYAFSYCSKLATVVAPQVATIGMEGFGNCAALTAADFPLLASVGQSAFTGCKNITSVNFPLLTSLGKQAFSGCSGLATVSLLVLASVPNYAFRSCTALKLIDLPAATTIESAAFYGSGLETLILRHTEAVCKLGATSAFSGTPIASGNGYIYVPMALVNDYKAATNWSTYAAQIRAIEDYPDITGG